MLKKDLGGLNKMFGEINKKVLTESVRGSKNKLRVLKHNEQIELEEIDSDKDFKKRILG